MAPPRPRPLPCFLLSALLIIAAASAARALDPVVQRAVDHAAAHADGRVAGSFAAADYRADAAARRDLPIGVFDSGVGGLTVLEALRNFDVRDNDTGAAGPDGRPDFAGERFIYLGDQANMPYGNYPAAQRTEFLRELILRDAVFLLGRRFRAEPGDEAARMDKPPVKAIVVACNTATAYGLEDIRAAIRAWRLPIPVVGVVEAGARGLAETRGTDTGAVAILATAGTCASDVYPRTIARVMGERAPAMVQQGSTTLAASIEGDASAGATPAAIVERETRQFLEQRRAAGAAQPIDTLVLGCTHYPLVAREIVETFQRLARQPAADGTMPYAGLVTAELRIVDPAQWTAEDLWRQLAQAGLLRAKASPAPGRDLFFISAPSGRWPGVQRDADGGLTRDYKYARDPGDPAREDTVVVPLTPARLPASSAQLVRERLPRTWESMRAGG